MTHREKEVLKACVCVYRKEDGLGISIIEKKQSQSHHCLGGATTSLIRSSLR